METCVFTDDPDKGVVSIRWRGYRRGGVGRETVPLVEYLIGQPLVMEPGRVHRGFRAPALPN